ncbi:hypothetical protein LTR66_017267, partial [Elasticomyces elasticus]
DSWDDSADWLGQDSDSDDSDDVDDNDNEVPLLGPTSTFDATKELPIDLTADLDSEIRRHIPTKRSSSPSPQPTISHNSRFQAEAIQRSTDKLSGMLWRDAGALTLYKQNASDIADEYLKNHLARTGSKMKTSRKRNAQVKHPHAYRQGKEDSKKIDVKRRRIQGKEDAEDEGGE